MLEATAACLDKLDPYVSAKCSEGTVDSVLSSPAVISIIRVTSLFRLYKLCFYFFFVVSAHFHFLSAIFLLIAFGVDAVLFLFLDSVPVL